MEDNANQPELTGIPPAETPAPAPPVEVVSEPEPPKKKKRPYRPTNLPVTARPITYADVPGLDASAMDPVVPPSKLVLRAVNAVGIPKEWLDNAKIRASQELGRFFTMKITGRVLLVKSFTSISQVEEAMKVAGEIANNTKNTPEQRVSAVSVMAKAAEAFAKMSDQMMTLAEKTSPVKASTEKPRNLPPTVAVQVNMPGASPPSPALGIPANFGDTVTETSPQEPQ